MFSLCVCILESIYRKTNLVTNPVIPVPILGSDLTIDCENAPENAEITWTFREGKLRPNVHKSSRTAITITGVKLQNFGVYTCFASIDGKTIGVADARVAREFALA